MPIVPKKKRALIICIPILLVLLIGVGAFFWMQSCDQAEKNSAVPPEPSPQPSFTLTSPSALPTATPFPEESPDGGDAAFYMLPLVPIWEEDAPTATPAPTASPSQTPAPTASPSQTPETTQLPEPVAGVYSSACKDVLLIGIEEGRAAAILLLRAKEDTLSVLAIPTSTLTDVYELDANNNILEVHQAPIGNALSLAHGGSEQSMWNLVWAVRSLTGIKMPEYIGVDISCVGEVLNALGGVQGARQTFTAENFATLLLAEGGMDAATLEDFGLGLTNTMRKVSIWELPALKRATKGKICGSLSGTELIGLAMSIKNTTVLQCEELPTRKESGGSVVDASSAYAMLRSLYR